MVQKIAFVSVRDGNDEVYTMNSDGSDQINLTNNPADDWFPTWSPDGKRIVFSSARDGEPATIYIMNADGSNLIRLTEPGNSLPAWSPDGTRIAFACYLPNSKKREICVMNIDGSGKNQLTKDKSYNGFPNWSPDGKELSMVAIEMGTTKFS